MEYTLRIYSKLFDKRIEEIIKEFFVDFQIDYKYSYTYSIYNSFISYKISPSKLIIFKFEGDNFVERLLEFLYDNKINCELIGKNKFR